MSATSWKLRPADEAAVGRIARELGLPRAIARLMVLRGLDSPTVVEQFRRSRDSLDAVLAPIQTPGMEKAVARIKRAVATQEPFMIYGDYDCDGVTSAAVLYRYLKRGQKANVEAYLPDRFKDGYGVTAAAVERIAARGIKLILTCDNGIGAHAAAEKAKALGVEIVVTDHHMVPEVLPDVHAIVHPALEFPHLKDLAGVGVAYLFTLAMEGGFNARMETFLDFVTLGTVGDVVPLDGPNRPLVWAGLGRYRAGRSPYPGIKALLAVAKSNAEGLTAQDVGFQLVPRLNAAGRLETPDLGFRLLATNDHEEAAVCAEHLDAVNRQRRDMSAELEASVIARVESEWDFEAEPFLVLADQQFHHGITGIIAGRLKEKYRVPVLLFSGHGNDPWKASGRAPEGVHLYEALFAARQHLLGFGGHAGAAGCSALPTELMAVRRVLNQHVAALGWQRPQDAVWLDAELPFGEATEALLEELDRLEPFGQKNPMPVFGLLHARVIGKRVVKTHLFLTLDDGRDVREVVAWNKAGDAEALTGYVRLSYQPRISHFKGRHIEFVATRIEPGTPPAPVQLSSPAPLLVDRRGDEPERVLAALGPTAQLYALPGRVCDPPEQVTLLDPFHPRPGRGPIVLADLPHDLAAWESLLAVGQPLTAAWGHAPDEPLDADGLLAFYAAMAASPELPWGEVVAALAPHRRQAALAGTRVLREAGLLVVRQGQHVVLAPPEGAIALTRLPSFEAARAAEAFRERLRLAPAAALAGVGG